MGFSRLVEGMGRWTSLLLAVYFGFSSYALLYRYAWTQLVVPFSSAFLAPAGHPKSAAGYFLLVFFAVLRINLVGSWFLGMFYTYFCDRKWRSNHRNQLIAQAPRNYKAGDLRVWEPTKRPRMCNMCDRNSSDRVYHDYVSDRCLPVFDHSCEWLCIAVYLRTIKPYLYVLALLPVDLFVTSILIVVASTTSPMGITHTPFLAIVALPLLFLAVACATSSWKQWQHLAFRNETRHQPRRELLAYKITFLNDRHFSYIYEFEGNPWDLGQAENIRQVLGCKRWMWLLFFWQPERVAKYGRYNPAFDLPFSENVLQMRGAILSYANEPVPVARPTLSEAPTTTRAQGRRRASASSPSHGEGSSSRRRNTRKIASDPSPAGNYEM